MTTMSATAEMHEAVSMCARLEGLLLDPVYSGKAMAGLIGHIRAGRYRASASANDVVFIHTGGTPALFAYR
jgi:1-aminocyclopropane-1-carboxylate deaminase/D-cysteine desulfhydrase-like pyridoxal-dependent ACC family enzyme